jgi:hypothetical protein
MRTHVRLPGGEFEYAVLAKLREFAASACDSHTQVGESQLFVYTTRAKPGE